MIHIKGSTLICGDYSYQSRYLGEDHSYQRRQLGGKSFTSREVEIIHIKGRYLDEDHSYHTNIHEIPGELLWQHKTLAITTVLIKMPGAQHKLSVNDSFPAS